MNVLVKLLLVVLAALGLFGGGWYSGKRSEERSQNEHTLKEAIKWQARVAFAKTSTEVQAVQINVVLTRTTQLNMQLAGELHEAIRANPEFAALRRPAAVQRVRLESRQATAALVTCAYGQLSGCL